MILNSVFFSLNANVSIILKYLLTITHDESSDDNKKNLTFKKFY